MKSGAHGPRDLPGPKGMRSPLAIGDREEAELAAIALLCLLFAWPPEERRQPHLGWVSE